MGKNSDKSRICRYHYDSARKDGYNFAVDSLKGFESLSYHSDKTIDERFTDFCSSIYFEDMRRSKACDRSTELGCYTASSYSGSARGVMDAYNDYLRFGLRLKKK